jgi:hypothetical protein
MNKLLKSAAMAIGAATAIAASAIVATGPAEAGPSYWTGLTVCTDANFQGLCLTNSTPLYVWDPVRELDKRLQDSISSISNQSGSTVCFSKDNNMRGDLVVRLTPGQYVRDLTGYQNDIISSWQPC